MLKPRALGLRVWTPGGRPGPLGSLGGSLGSLGRPFEVLGSPLIQKAEKLPKGAFQVSCPRVELSISFKKMKANNATQHFVERLFLNACFVLWTLGTLILSRRRSRIMVLLCRRQAPVTNQPVNMTICSGCFVKPVRDFLPFSLMCISTTFSKGSKTKRGFSGEHAYDFQNPKRRNTS